MTQEEKAKAYDEALERARKMLNMILDNELLGFPDQIREIFPQLAESEDEKIRKLLVWQVYRNIEDETNDLAQSVYDGIKGHDPDIEESIEDWKKCLVYLEKQKENPKSADSIPSDCASDAKCEDRWHKVSDSLPDNGRLVLANDCLRNTLLARYDGEGNWEVSVYDNEDYYCRNTITKWCEIPSEKQKEQKPVDYDHEMWKNCEANFEGGKKEVMEHPEKYGLQKPADLSEMMVHKEPYIAPVPTPMVADEQKPDTRDADDLQRPQPQGVYKQVVHSIFKMLKDKDFYEIQPSHRVSLLNDIRVKCKDAIEVAPILDAPSWKPSEEQMEALRRAVNKLAKTDVADSVGLSIMYDNLKKL